MVAGRRKADARTAVAGDRPAEAGLLAPFTDVLTDMFSVA